MPFYIKLMHGRREGEELEDWGSDGPLLGPFHWMHFTYGHIGAFCYESANAEPIEVPPHDWNWSEDGLLWYDGIGYGDVEFQLEPPEDCVGEWTPEFFDPSNMNVKSHVAGPDESTRDVVVEVTHTDTYRVVLTVPSRATWEDLAEGALSAEDSEAIDEQLIEKCQQVIEHERSIKVLREVTPGFAPEEVRQP